jgi:hypothetical protein
MPKVRIVVTGDGNPELATSFEADFPNTDEGKAEHLVYQNAVNDGIAAVIVKVGQIMSKYRLKGDDPDPAIKAMLEGIGASDFDV